MATILRERTIHYQYCVRKGHERIPVRIALKPLLVTESSEWNLRTISSFLDMRLNPEGTRAPHRNTFVNKSYNYFKASKNLYWIQSLMILQRTFNLSSQRCIH